jgi:sugar/nucleoside kinase (ribokinase family)
MLSKESQQPNPVTFNIVVKEIDKDLIVDSNGCGDSFVGGFLAKLSLNDGIEELNQNGMSFRYSRKQVEEAVEAGSFMAGMVVQ